MHFSQADVEEVLYRTVILGWHCQGLTTKEEIHKGSNYQPEEPDVWFVRIKNHPAELGIDLRGPHNLILYDDREQVRTACPC